MEARRKETQGTRERMMEALRKVLTRSQRASYNKLLGEPFDLKTLVSDAAPAVKVGFGGPPPGEEPPAATKEEPGDGKAPSPAKKARGKAKK
jgi:hypothetical protein